MWRTNDEYGAFIWVLVNIAISAAVLVTVSLMERKRRRKEVWS